MLKGESVGDNFEAVGQCYHMSWIIKDFFSRPSFDGEEWYSPQFRFRNVMWFLSVFPNAIDDHSDEYIRIRLNCEVIRFVSFCTMFIFGIHDNNGSLYKSCVITDFSAPERRKDYYYFRDIKLVRRDDLNNDKNLASGGTVKFSLLITLANNRIRLNATSDCIIMKATRDCIRLNADSQTSTYNDLTDLSQDLQNLFLSEQNSDVTIKVVDKEFRAHSQILAARSSVFAPMFTHDMKERNSGIVDIPDIHPEVFRQFLMFLYCGHVESMSTDNALVLYCAAEKYDVKELKIRCSDFMKKDMSVETFGDVISLAIRYNDTELINYSINFFVKNFKSIILTVKWMSFLKECPVQANELIVKAANHFVPE